MNEEPNASEGNTTKIIFHKSTFKNLWNKYKEMQIPNKILIFLCIYKA